MKIEKLRNNHKKEIIIGTVLTVVIGGALTFRLTHSKYRVTQSIDLGSGVINYKPYDFKIMAMYQQKDGSSCTEDNCYNELTGRMPLTGYVINESKSYCNLNGNKDNNVVIENVNGKPLLSNLIKGNKCYLYFDKQILGADQVLANLTIKEGIPDFSKTATTDEGVFVTSDGVYGGTTYYWRGAVTNNHVIFANKCWRIVRINGDSTIRLIYNGAIQSGNVCIGNGTTSDAVIMGLSSEEKQYATNNGQKNNPSYVGWTYILGSQRITSGIDSNAKAEIEKWYSNNIENNSAYSSKVVIGKFCNDRNIDIPPSRLGWTTYYTTSWNTNTGYNYRFAYAGAKRLCENYNPTFDCPEGDVYTLKVGAITADEVAFAGGVYGGDYQNQSFYLYNGQKYWTMSPFAWNDNAIVFYVNDLGDLVSTVVSLSIGHRPVINLKSDVTFSSGDGTQNNPYTVSGN